MTSAIKVTWMRDTIDQLFDKNTYIIKFEAAKLKSCCYHIYIYIYIKKKALIVYTYLTGFY